MSGQTIVSTAVTHTGPPNIYVGAYPAIRATLDYGWHRNPTAARQVLQDCIIHGILSHARTPPLSMTTSRAAAGAANTRIRPWLIFTAGAMGVGKSHFLRWLRREGVVPTDLCVHTDLDAVRRRLPEWPALVASDTANGTRLAGASTQRESGLMVEIAQAAALEQGLPLIIDGSLRDVDWWRTFITKLKASQAATLPPQKRHRIAIWHVVASEEVVVRRAAARAAVTGRAIPRDLLLQTLTQVPLSVAALTPLVDIVATIDTGRDAPAPPLLVGCSAMEEEEAAASGGGSTTRGSTKTRAAARWAQFGAIFTEGTACFEKGCSGAAL
tara:strand:- start:282 stop:1262 length:981 start_codon:yes stop_codon:yes gene_type:complete